MKDDATEFGEANDVVIEPASSGERRRSVQDLQNMLRRVSQSPFHHEPQNGARRATNSPFYSYFLESSGQTNDSAPGASEEAANADGFIVRPPVFRSSPMDRPHSVSDQPGFYSQNDKTTLTPRSISQQSPSFHDVTLNTPDIFKSAQPSVSHNGYSSNVKTDGVSGTEGSIFAAKEVNRSFSASGSFFPKPEPSTNPFYNSTNDNAACNKTRDIFNKEGQSPVHSDMFSRTPDEKFDFYSPSLPGSDPPPNSVSRNIDFSSFEDPFVNSPLQLSDPFQDAPLYTSDVFSPKAEGGDGAAKVPPTRPKPPRPKPPKPSPPRPPPPASVLKGAVASLDKPEEIVLTSPQGSQHSLLQPTPMILAHSPSVSPSHSPKLTHVSTFRRPPKPLPRIRRSKTSLSKLTPPGKPAKPERPTPPSLPTLDFPENCEPPEYLDPTPPTPPPKPLPKLSPKLSIKPLQKPVIRHKPKTKDKETLDPQNYVVFEDILLIGQEQCVEDWPEDSPEVQSNFKPRGTLRLRRESLMAKTDSETEEQASPRSSTKKKDHKFKMSMSSRRGSKERFSDELVSRSRTNSSRKSSKEYLTDEHYSSQELKKDENEDPDQWTDYKKPHLKNKVSSLLRRSSASAAFAEQKHMNGNVAHESKDFEFKKSIKDSFRRHSEGTTMDTGSGESGDDVESRKLRNLKGLKFLTKGLNKNLEDEPKGAQGYTPQKGSKEDLFGSHSSLCSRKTSRDDGLDPFNKAALMNDDYSEKSSQSSLGLNGYEEETEEWKSKTSKLKPLALSRKTKPNQATPEQARYDDEFDDDIAALKGKQALGPTEMYNCDEDQLDICEPKKTSKLKAFKKIKRKSKSTPLQQEEPLGATSSDYMSEAARAELMAAEKDRCAMDAFEDGEGDGDTDSLMEWWDTVEQWDEVPSDEEEMSLREDESKSFSVLADKVQRALRLFNKVFMERGEVLWQSVIILHAIADDISTFHSKARIAGITGGTTTAVGGATAVAGLVLLPFTFGVSVLITAVGVGIATAGSITTASAAISDNVNNANDKKKVETLLLENEATLLELSKILHFANTGLFKLRGHPFLRSGTQHYSQDWEVRRAVQMIGMVDSPVMKATDFIDSAVSSVQGLFQGMNKYFLKDSRELKKGCKKEIIADIKDVANVLNDCIVELNGAREELQESMGEV